MPPVPKTVGASQALAAAARRKLYGETRPAPPSRELPKQQSTKTKLKSHTNEIKDLMKEINK